jgi:hypothetical protein
MAAIGNESTSEQSRAAVTTPSQVVDADKPKRVPSPRRIALAKTPRRRDKRHLEYVASKSCLVCGRSPSDAHHLRFAEPRALGRKVSDEFTVPLCRTHHRDLHARGDERAWWEELRIDASGAARDLWLESKGRSTQAGLETAEAAVL